MSITGHRPPPASGPRRLSASAEAYSGCCFPGVDLEVPQLLPLRFVGVVLSGVSPAPSHAPCSTNRTRGSGTYRHG